MAVSRDDLIPRVRDLLGDNPYTTTSTTTGTGGTVTVLDGTKWAEGDIGEWQTGTVGYEQFLVTADPVGNDLTVSRGYNGTTAESHGSGDRIAQGPTFTGRNIQQRLNAALRTLWPQVYKVEDLDVTPVAGQYWYELTATGAVAILGIVSVTQRWGETPLLRIGKYGPNHRLPVRYDPRANTDVITNGQGLFLPYLYHPTNAVVVTVMEKVTGTTDIEDDGQFPVADYLIYHAAGSLTAATEISRVAEGADLESTGTTSAGARTETGRSFLYEARKMLQQLAINYRMHYQPIYVGR